MMPIAQIVHTYYDRKRRVNYIKITRILQKQNPQFNKV